ncbi:uncharacterized protein B0T15DRAFT_325389 [Chaetomium strumarium]|uniref:F-box domain-containing protein n=1 Tax=Chaetomium strumarium TaxID=1170767 RepID=A0AAJ0GKZ2_9PEZI|nr:hypothetical protein B0T15DRAFT_325389 [Chaetomium strumarium]
MARVSDGGQTLAMPSPLPPLLRLTPQIRRRIYFYLGLARWDGRPFRFNLHAGQFKLPHGLSAHELSWSFMTDPNSFHGLLLSCRTIHAEATALLYSANQFILYYSAPPAQPRQPTSLRPLHTLHALSAPTLLFLSNLKIVLHEASCHAWAELDWLKTCCLEGLEDQEHAGLRHCKQSHGGLHPPPLLSPACAGDDDDRLAAAHALLREWRSAAARLCHVAPKRLALCLVCDIDPEHPRAIDVANSVVAPIRLLPPLKECSIRLAKTPDRRLQQLAQDTVIYACRIPTPSPKPPSSATTTLASLPRELRIQILEYTDLVTPRRQVAWSRHERAYVKYFFKCPPDPAPWTEHEPDELHASQFSRCWEDIPTGNGCFCRRRHAAFSLDCKCWAPPTALFLVCRTLYEDAQFVFFSSNRFTVHDFKARPPGEVPVPEQRRVDDEPVPSHPYPYERLAASEFLRDIVPTLSLAHLRFLELAFPPYPPPSWPATQHPAMQDWWKTIDWLRNKINLSGLTIRLLVSDVVLIGQRDYRRTITVEEGDMMMTAYMDLMRPLKRLADDGLARFYAHFPYPWAFTEELRYRRFTEGDPLEPERLALKKRAEQYVMGHRYERLYANGREEPRLSDWYEPYY